MKFTMKTTVILAIATFSFLTTSCKKDKENPTITVNEPEMHTHFNWGEEVHIEATFSDDRGLKNYTVMIGDEAGTMDETINFMETGTTEELSFEFHEHLVVPNDAPMMAWIHFTVTDAEDKVTTLKWMIHFDM